MIPDKLKINDWDLSFDFAQDCEEIGGIKRSWAFTSQNNYKFRYNLTKKKSMEKFVKYLFALLSFIVPLSVYSLMVSRHIAPGDSTEMVTAAMTLGVPHQPGYPINTLIGNLFYRSALPLTDAGRVNFASSAVSALTVFVFYLTVTKLLHYKDNIPINGEKIDVENTDSISNYTASFTASMFLAFSTIYWQYALKFEVFPLNNLLAVSIIYLSLSYLEIRENRRHLSDLVFYLLLFLTGFSFTHHQTIIFIFPALFFLLKGDIFKRIKDRDYNFLHLLALISGSLPYFAVLMYLSSQKPLLNQGMVETVWDAFNNLRRTDFGTFSAYQKGIAPPVLTTYPVDNILYYSRYIVKDFSVLGAVFALGGVLYLLRKNRRLLLFALLGFVFSGWVFLSFANFPLTSTFNQATVRRFQMLPNIFVGFMIAFGVYPVLRLINSAGKGDKMTKLGVFASNVLLVFTAGLPVYANFGYAKAVTTDLTEKYIASSYSSLEKDALYLYSGDIPSMTSQYFRFAADRSESFKAFSPGQFHLEWFNKWLAETYPEVKIPEPQPDKMFTLTSQIVDANYLKWPIYIGPDLVITDAAIEKNYTLYPRHLLFQAVKKGGDLNTVVWQAENDHLWSTIDPDQLDMIRKYGPSFEEEIIFHYVRHFYNTGYIYEDVGMYEDAKREYERVLEINPLFAEAAVSLSRLYGEKLENKDYPKAIEYLQRYVNILGPYGGEQVQAAYQKAEEYGKKYEEMLKKQEEEIENSEQETENPPEEGEQEGEGSMNIE